MPVRDRHGEVVGPGDGALVDPTKASYVPIAGSPFANAGSHQFLPPGTNAAGDGDSCWCWR